MLLNIGHLFDWLDSSSKYKIATGFQQSQVIIYSEDLLIKLINQINVQIYNLKHKPCAIPQNTIIFLFFHITTHIIQICIVFYGDLINTPLLSLRFQCDTFVSPPYWKTLGW